MTWDAVVIGSGFGGAMAAHQLVAAGQRVLMLERGGWVGRGPQNWGPNGVGLVTPHFTTESPYDVTADGQRFLVIVPEGQQATRLTVLTNWPSALAGR